MKSLYRSIIMFSIIIFLTCFHNLQGYSNPQSIFQNKPLNKNKAVNNYSALGGNIFIGYGNLNGLYGEYFSNPVFLGINLDIIKRRFVFQIDDYIGFNTSKMPMEFANETILEDNKLSMHFILGGNIGYTIFNSKVLKIVPLTGIGADNLSVYSIDISDDPKSEPFLPFYKIGGYVDIKALKIFKNNYSFNYDNSYSCLRISIGLNSLIGSPKYSYYDGSMFYLTIGMGGLSER